MKRHPIMEYVIPDHLPSTGSISQERSEYMSEKEKRIVPIHPAIYHFAEQKVLAQDGKLCVYTQQHHRKALFYPTLERLGIAGNPKHTPHDCRHTFSALCEKYGVRENDRKRMLGHSFGGDVTNAVYGHRTLEELRTEIEKIKVPFVTNCD